MATDTFLSEEEVRALTERKVRPAQSRALKSMPTQSGGGQTNEVIP